MVAAIDNGIGPGLFRLFASQTFKERMKAGEPTIDGRGAEASGDLLVDEPVDIGGRHRVRRFVANESDENVEIAEVVFAGTALAKAALEVLLEAKTGLLHGSLHLRIGTRLACL